MPTGEPDRGVFTRERLLTSVLALLTLLALYVCYLIIQPFIPAMAFALALSVATQRPYRWLRTRVKSQTAAAAIAVVLIAVLIVGPVTSLIVYIIQMATDHIGELQSGTLKARLEQQPLIGPLIREASQRLRIEEQIGAIGEAIASRASGVLSGSIGVITQLGIMLFVLFFLFRDCGAALAALRKLMPLSEREADRLFDRVGSTISATVNGSLTVALIQAILAGIVYMILGVPGAALWAAVTFIMALVPVLGTFLVWAPIALYLALSGSLVKALFLVGWGALVVSSVDNILYPYLVGDKLRLHTVPTFFSVIGGIALFGPAGLILGPLALALTIALIDVWWVRTEHGQAAEQALEPEPTDRQHPSTRLQTREHE